MAEASADEETLTHVVPVADLNVLPWETGWKGAFHAYVSAAIVRRCYMLQHFNWTPQDLGISKSLAHNKTNKHNYGTPITTEKGLEINMDDINYQVVNAGLGQQKQMLFGLNRNICLSDSNPPYPSRCQSCTNLCRVFKMSSGLEEPRVLKSTTRMNNTYIYRSYAKP